MKSLVTYSDSATNANAFASTFAFLPTLKPMQKKQKSLQAIARETADNIANFTRHIFVRKEELPITAGLRNWRFSASYDSFVVKQTFVLRMNICGKNRQLLLAAKRYLQCLTTIFNLSRSTRNGQRRGR
jgi:hypothetical protein